ncbi:hypothetical protein HCU40_12465 [Pseudanabaena biceps]|nr:hypothetical protein [Pseudanabaena biceps]
MKLSLNPLFRRGHSALFKAIGALSFREVSKVENGEGEDSQPREKEEMPLLELIAEVVQNIRRQLTCPVATTNLSSRDN